MIRSSLACSLIGALCALTLAPQTAEAVGCASIVKALVPLDGETLPVNAQPLAAGECSIGLDSWEVIVDGEPGILESRDPGFAGVFASLEIEPAPAEGSIVEIRACSQGCGGVEQEYDLSRTYTVTDEDPDAPSAPSLLELDFADEIIIEFDLDDEEEVMVPVRRWTVRFDPPALDEPVVWEVEVGPSGGPTDAARIMEDGDEFIVVTRYKADAGHEVCATARAHDLAGNVSADSMICQLVGEDETLPDVPGDDSNTGEPTTGEPTTGDNVSGPDVANDDLDASGCACTAGQGSPVGTGALLGLVVLGLRRRWRR